MGAVLHSHARIETSLTTVCIIAYSICPSVFVIVFLDVAV